MNGYMGYPFYPNTVSSAIPNALARSAPSLGTRSALSSVARPGILSSLGGAVRSFSFTGFLNGASKTLGVINQAIPIFYQVKPMFNNAKTMFRVMKEVNNQASDNIIKEKVSETKKNSSNIKDSSPTFFA